MQLVDANRVNASRSAEGTPVVSLDCMNSPYFQKWTRRSSPTVSGWGITSRLNVGMFKLIWNAFDRIALSLNTFRANSVALHRSASTPILKLVKSYDGSWLIAYVTSVRRPT